MNGLNRVLSFLGKPMTMKFFSLKRKFWFVYKWKYQKFGANSCIFKPMMLYNCDCIIVGENSFIRDGARIEPIKSWNDEEYSPCIEIGNNVSIEQRFHLTCADSVIIKDNSVISADVMITDISHCYDDIIANGVLDQGIEVKATEIGENCFIGMGSRIMPGVKLGKNCVVGANAVVTKSFPDYSVVAGSPAKMIKKYDVETNEWMYVKDEK